MTDNEEKADLENAETETETRIRLLPAPPNIDDDEGFKNHDLFKLQEFGETLGNLFMGVQDLSVVLLDDDWGRGKTTFVKQWAGLMRNKGCKVIYFDAFERDLLNDPFTALTSAISRHKEIETNKGKLSSTAIALVESLATNAVTLYSGGLVTKTELSSIESAFTGDEESEVKKVQAFKDCLTEIAGDGELIIIVDELDRCRPDFALGLLETIKHFFEADKVGFLLVAGQEQLASMVTKAYGYDGELATKYLDKFCQLRVSLPHRKDIGNNHKKIFLEHLITTMNLKPIYKEGVIEKLVFISEKNQLSLRDIERILSNYVVVTVSRNLIELYNSSVLVFCILKHIAPSVYEKIRMSEKVTWSEIATCLNLDKNLGTVGEWYLGYDSFLTILLRGCFEEDEIIQNITTEDFLEQCSVDRIYTGGGGGFVSRDEFIRVNVDLIESVGEFKPLVVA